MAGCVLPPVSPISPQRLGSVPVPSLGREESYGGRSGWNVSPQRKLGAGSLLLPPAVWWHPASLSEPAGDSQAPGCPSFC